MIFFVFIALKKIIINDCQDSAAKRQIGRTSHLTIRLRTAFLLLALALSWYVFYFPFCSASNNKKQFNAFAIANGIYAQRRKNLKNNKKIYGKRVQYLPEAIVLFNLKKCFERNVNFFIKLFYFVPPPNKLCACHKSVVFFAVLSHLRNLYKKIFKG